MMCFSPDNKRLTGNSLIEFFIFKASREGAGRQTTYKKAINSLASFLHARGCTLLQNPETVISDWIVLLCASGISMKTALPYFNAIAGLYNKAVGEGIAPETDIFVKLRSQIKSGGDSLWKSWMTHNSFERLKNMTRSRQKLADVGKLVLYSLTRGCLPLAVAAKAKIESATEADWELLDIDSAQFTGNRKYLFSIERKGLTPAQLARSVNDAVLELLEQMNVSHTTVSDDTLRSYWAYAALNIGIAPHVVLSYLKGVPSGLPILSVCKRDELSEETQREVAGSVAEMFTANPPKWYVMRLRPRVSFDELVNRLGDMANELPKPKLFYPCEEIYRRTGKKIAVSRKPVIPDIVFFKYREADVFRMFQKIGDIAWGYKTGGAHGNRYAAVPRQEFMRFQEAIGQFTPNYEVAPIGDIPLREGDRVVIIGGNFADCPAMIQKIEKPDAHGRIIYRMSLLDTGFEWTVSEDSRIVRRAQ